MQTILPKTSDTIGLLDRWLIEDGASLLDLMSGNVTVNDDGEIEIGNRTSDAEATRRMYEEDRSVSLWYIIGTSLLFELAVLGLASFIFCRRDY